MTTATRTLKIAFSYGLAAGVIAWVARGVSVSELWATLGQARLSLFVPVSLGVFLCWYLGETLLYSRLFSLFHERVSWKEMLPLSATFYFLQCVNGALAGGVFALLLQRRKRIHWLDGGLSLVFLGMIDFQVMALLVLAAAAFAHRSPLTFVWRYAALALVLCWACSAFWLSGPPRWAPARAVYEWRAMGVFRKARLVDYLQLAAIRAPIFLAQGLALYLDLRAFGVGVAPGYVLELSPAILLLTALPLTPIGIGTEQAAVVLGFSHYGPRQTLLAMSLAMSGAALALRFLFAPVAVPQAIPLLPGKPAPSRDAVTPG